MGTRLPSGNGGFIRIYDGTAWQTLGGIGLPDFKVVSGAARDDVWALSNSFLHHFIGTDGGGTSMPLPAGGSFNGLFAFANPQLGDGGTNLAMVAGSGGRVAVCVDGGSVEPEPVPLSALLNAVWATSPDDVYVGGNSQSVLRRTASGWSLVTQGFGFSGVRAFHGARGVTYIAGFGTNGAPAAFVSPDGGNFNILNFPIGPTGQANAVAVLDAGQAWFGLSTGGLYRTPGLTYRDAGVPGSVQALFPTAQRLWMVVYDSAGQKTEVRAFCPSELP